jgi:hypothetical protein
MTHRFEAFQEALPGLRTLQSTAVAQPIAHGHMAAFDGLGRLTARPMQACPKVLRAGTGRGYRLDIRLVVVGDDLIWDQPAALDSLAKEGLGTRRVSVVPEQHIHDHAVLVNRPVQVALLTRTEQEHLVDEPAPADAPMSSNLCGQQGSEHLGPGQDRAVRDVDAAFGQEFHHLPARQRIGQIPAHGHDDDVPGPAIAVEG